MPPVSFALRCSGRSSRRKRSRRSNATEGSSKILLPAADLPERLPSSDSSRSRRASAHQRPITNASGASTLHASSGRVIPATGQPWGRPAKRTTIGRTGSACAAQHGAMPCAGRGAWTTSRQPPRRDRARFAGDEGVFGGVPVQHLRRGFYHDIFTGPLQHSFHDLRSSNPAPPLLPLRIRGSLPPRALRGLLQP